ARAHISRVFSFLLVRRPPRAALLPYTTLFRSRSRGRWPPCPTAAWCSTARWWCSTTTHGPTSSGCSDGPSSCGSTTWPGPCASRSEEHTSELQSRENLVCRLLLEKKKQPLDIP